MNFRLSTIALLSPRWGFFEPRRLRKFLTKTIILLVIVSMLSTQLAGAVQAAPTVQTQEIKSTPESTRVLGPVPSEATTSETGSLPDAGEVSYDSQSTWNVDNLGGSIGRSSEISSAAALPQSDLPSGGIIFEGPMETHRDPIAAIPGHRHALHFAFEQPLCGSCNASAFIGPEPYVWPSHIYGQCWTGYGSERECVTETFLNQSTAL